MFNNIRLLKLDPRDYWRDLLGLLVVALAIDKLIFYFLGFLKGKGLYLTDNNYFPLKREAILVAVWLIAYLFLRKWLLLRLRPLLHKLSGRRIFENTFSMDLTRIESEWEFQGNIQVTEEGLQVINTPSGCLIKNRWLDTKIWDDFSATFDIDFPLEFSIEDDYICYNSYLWIGKYLKDKRVQFRNVLGIIFRATSLDDHFMLGVLLVGKRIIIRPHVRVSGDLDIPLHNSSRNTFELVNRPKLLHLKMLVKGNRVKLYVKERKWEKCFDWLLPTFYKTNLYEAQKNSDTTGIVTRKIPFKNTPGMFGFRNYGNEIATVSYLRVNGKFSYEEKQLFIK